MAKTCKTCDKRKINDPDLKGIITSVRNMKGLTITNLYLVIRTILRSPSHRASITRHMMSNPHVRIPCWISGRSKMRTNESTRNIIVGSIWLWAHGCHMAKLIAGPTLGPRLAGPGPRIPGWDWEEQRWLLRPAASGYMWRPPWVGRDNWRAPEYCCEENNCHG